MGMMLRGFIGKPIADDFAAQLTAETLNVAKKRVESAGNDPVIVIKIHSDVDADIPSNARDVLDFILCFDAYDKAALRATMQSKVSAILTAVRMASTHSYEYRDYPVRC
jgi:hypothetical protein